MRLSPGKLLVAALAICAAVWPGALAKDVKKVISTGKQFAVLKPFDELMETFVRDNEIQRIRDITFSSSMQTSL